jgi:peroxiredoxin
LPQIRAASGSLVAISPELPDHAIATAQKNGLGFEILSDLGNKVARQFGLVFQLPPDLRDLYKNAFGNDLAVKNGDASYELPIPATFVIARDGTVRAAFVEPDYTQRLEPAEIVQALHAANAAP